MSYHKEIDTYSSELRKELFYKITDHHTIDQEKERITQLISEVLTTHSNHHLKYSKYNKSKLLAS